MRHRTLGRTQWSLNVTLFTSLIEGQGLLVHEPLHRKKFSGWQSDPPKMRADVAAFDFSITETQNACWPRWPSAPPTGRPGQDESLGDPAAPGKWTAWLSIGQTEREDDHPE